MAVSLIATTYLEIMINYFDYQYMLYCTDSVPLEGAKA